MTEAGRRLATSAAASLAALLLAACEKDDRDPAVEGQVEAPVDSAGVSPGWRFQEQGGGATIALVSVSGDAAIRMVCPGTGELRVNVPGFRPVGSEERMTFGQGGTVETLVADPSGDPRLGGVTATGPVPGNLETLLSGRVAANYGAQDSGPHPQPPADLVRRFVEACEPAGSSAEGLRPAAKVAVSACLEQDGAKLPAIALRAVGTEPFWGAAITGRCVTYSTPEDIDGTRIWTKFKGTPKAGEWTGYFQNRHFVLRTQSDPDCSDGMSDTVYPLAVTLAVDDEQRTGCADYR